MALCCVGWGRRRVILHLGLLCLGMLSTVLLSSVLRDRAQVDVFLLELRDQDSPEDVCNCTLIMQGDREETDRAKILTVTKSFMRAVVKPDEHYESVSKDCEAFQRSRKYLLFPLSQEEEDFPLAYSMVVHHKVQSFELLLRAIYAPQNVYCVHVDRTAPQETLRGILSIISCFDNVFLATRLEDVTYASWSRVQADLTCMKDLLYRSQTPWRYFINLCGQDFPIKTNLEIVKHLKIMNGANAMESETMPAHKRVRWMKVHKVVNGQMMRTSKDKEPPPSGIPIFSGGAYIVVSRQFVHFALEHPKAQALTAWAHDTYSPDEFLWATLLRMPGAPGHLPANRHYDISDVNSRARLVKWSYHEGPVEADQALYPPCAGKHVRAVCVYGTGDLPWMLRQPQLFANKFDMLVDPITIRCLDQFLRHKALSMVRCSQQSCLTLLPGGSVIRVGY